MCAIPALARINMRLDDAVSESLPSQSCQRVGNPGNPFSSGNADFDRRFPDTGDLLEGRFRPSPKLPQVG
jgi:hypothetical protein